MGNQDRFEQIVLPHLNAAFNLARWLTANDQDAEDVVQEAYLRAYKFLDGFREGNGRSWLLAIVRNTYYTWSQQNRPHDLQTSSDKELETMESNQLHPEAKLIQNANSELIRQTLNELPLEYREVIVLREIEGMSYKEISNIINIPLGTVMSRLARGRKQLQEHLICRLSGEK